MKNERTIVVSNDILDDFLSLVSLAAVESSERYNELKEITEDKSCEITKIMMNECIRIMQLATILADELCKEEDEVIVK
ncbi:hypothetical protein AB1283_00865 [Bacillus sp. S13(2024)]|uniref:hypothetical protein n=1 Tax=Bacillus sp. S13(2024) TaxID=3162885 RepID=UPI003D190F20